MSSLDQHVAVGRPQKLRESTALALALYLLQFILIFLKEKKDEYLISLTIGIVVMNWKTYLLKSGKLNPIMALETPKVKFFKEDSNKFVKLYQ